MINDLFKSYVEITRDISFRLRNDEEPVEMMKKREEILKQIELVNISPEEKKKAYINADAEKFDLQLKKIIELKQNEVKSKIKKLKVGRQAYRGYMANGREPNTSFSLKR